MSFRNQLDRQLVENAIGFHGMALQKIWESERGEEDLPQIGITEPDYSVYVARQKSLGFHDRSKRFKLQQFLVKKADTLYSSRLVEPPPDRASDFVPWDDFALPPAEVFMDIDSNDKVDHFLKTVLAGDVMYGCVLSKNAAGVLFKPLYCVGNKTAYLNLGSIKAQVPSHHLVPVDTRKGVHKSYTNSDIICCEVFEVKPSLRKIVCTMLRGPLSRAPDSVEYGLISEEQLPGNYKLTNARKNDGELYEQFLEQSPSFLDPRLTERLMQTVGLDSEEHYSNMSSLKGRFPSQEYAGELRNSQASKWAFRSVAEGIEHFKEGRHAEAFQCLNKALSIDPRNVEGLVARGALYANNGSFKKAVEDFEMALKINPAHANARKYMGETLVALGRSYEDENRIEDAKKAYQDCLNIIPHHEEAQNSLDFLKAKPFGKQIVEPTELELPTLNIKPSKQDLDAVGGGSKRDASDSRKDRKKDSKKERKKRHKKHQSSSSDSSSDSSDTSESSSASSSSSSESSSSSDSSGSRNKKRKRSKSEKKQKSLSPLSKRMSASMGNSSRTSDLYGGSVGGGGGSGVGGSGVGIVGVSGGGVGGGGSSVVGGGSGGQGSCGGGCSTQPGMDEYELKVRKFLEMPRDEEDYEEKVRRFVAEAAKYQKERKQLDDKAKKKKKKEEKKAKKESKKKRKSDEKKKSKKKDKDEDLLDDEKVREALKIFESFPVLDELGSKLSEYYTKMGKSGGSSAAVALSALLGSAGGKEKGGKDGSSGKSGATGDGGSGSKPLDDAKKDGKWRMLFNKDAKEAAQSSGGGGGGGSSSKAVAPKQYAFTNESDEESNSYEVMKMQQHQQTLEQRTSGAGSAQGSRSTRYDDDRAKASTSQMSAVKSGPVVLDKFGNFRLATAEVSKPPEPVAPVRRSRSKSNTNYGSSRSRSRSRSDRRRSRSGSYRRRFSRSRSRSFTRSRSRSYSRSRSRSRSYEKRRYEHRRIYRGRGGGGGHDGYQHNRMNNYGFRFHNNRGGYYHRRGTGGYRDFRDNRYNRGQHRPYRPRFPRGAINRYHGNRSYSRSGSKTPDRRQGGSPSEERPRVVNRRGSRERHRAESNDTSGRESVESRDSIDNRKSVDRELPIKKKDVEERSEKADSESPPPSKGIPLSSQLPEAKKANSSSNGSGSVTGGGRWVDKDDDDDDDDDDDGDREPPPPGEEDTSLEDLEKILSKARKERKEEMLERNKDLLKKGGF